MPRADNGETGQKAPPVGLGRTMLAIGPGIVVSGSVIGSGELINVPVQAASYGFVLLWAVIISCVIKYFLQVELGRHCLVHNRTTIQAFNSCPGPRLRGTSWLGLTYIACYTVSLVTIAGILEATAGLFSSLWPLKTGGVELGLFQIKLNSSQLWAIVVYVLTAIVLWRGLYGELEKLVTFLVVGFSLSVLVALFLIQGTDYALSFGDLADGLRFSLGSFDRAGVAFAVISLLGALGTTANELFMYPYWVLEKGYARYVGPVGATGWTDRARGWIRVLRLDTGAATLIATVITAAYFLVGGAVLHQHGRAWLFDADDVVNWPALCEKLAAAQDDGIGRPEDRIWELLPRDVRALVIRGAQSRHPVRLAPPEFLDALNNLVTRRDFYHEADFQMLTTRKGFPTQARGFLRRGVANLSDRELQRFNRLLLEETFPEQGSLTVLAHSVPTGTQVVEELSRIYTRTYGRWSYGLFMFGSFCTLFSTLVVVVAATGRMWSDLLSSMGVIRWEDAATRRRCNRIFQNIYLTGFLVVALFVKMPAEMKVMVGQYINGLFNTLLIMFGIGWVAFRTERRLRMSWPTAAMMLLTMAMILCCIAYGLFGQAQ